MTVQEIKKRKTELGLTNEGLSDRSGIPLSTIQKIFYGVTASPRQSTLDALEAALKQAEEESSAEDGSPAQDGIPAGEIYSAAIPSAAGQILKDASAAYAGTPVVKRPGDYTVEDYYALPDDQRVELIDGVFYDMATPTFLHQTITMMLAIQFYDCIERHGMSCHVIISPSDVRLDSDNRTMVQPDLYVVCREIHLRDRAYTGAPDLAVEVLSPSTRSRDLLLKTYKYRNAGVREYWMIDPEKRVVMVYNFAEPDLPASVYSFDDMIPVGISDGRCAIDFAKVHRSVAEAYGETA